MISPLAPNISQYANSPRMLQLMEDWNSDLDPRSLLANFIANIYNLNTAVGYGLDMWGRRVGVSRVLSIPNPTATYFGFSEGGGYQPFGQAPFYSGTFATIQVTLSDADYRVLIGAKSLSNISACSAPIINKILYELFLAPGRPYAGSRAYCLDLGGMSIEYYFIFELTQLDISILKNSGALQRPAGVQARLFALDASTCFGFAGTGLQPFGQGTFQAVGEL